MKDEALDFIPMIVLLGLVISICFGLILPIYRESRELIYTESYDKVLGKVQGESRYRSGDNTINHLSYEEAILTLGGQSYFMPNPRIIDIGGKVYQVQASAISMADPGTKYDGPTNEYIPGNRNTLKSIKDTLNNWCTEFSNKYGQNGFKLHFTIRFTAGVNEGESDDCYALYVIGLDEYRQEVYLKCLNNGYIESIPEKTKLLYYK